MDETTSNARNSKSARRLGRGLDSLIGGGDYVSDADESGTSAEARQIPIDQIAPNPYQPRKQFDEVKLNELTDSIRQEGVLQPLIVSPAAGDELAQGHPFLLIAGERRLRAARQAGLDQVPVVVRSADHRQLMEWAMIENIQRTDLNPIERARGYRDYLDRFKLTQEQVAQRMGQARATVANYLRLIELSEPVQQLIADEQISFGHAKVLAGVSDDPDRQISLARRVAAEGLSVRKLEQLIAPPSEQNTNKTKSDSSVNPSSKPAYVRDIEQQLTEIIGTKVTIQPGRAKNSGKIVVEYYSLDDFDHIAGKLGLNVKD